MAKKDRTFAAKLAHDQKKKEAKLCPVCGAGIQHAVLYEARYKNGKQWSPVRKVVDICDCNKDWVYNQVKK
ncbi:MAG: hypothetical protein JXA60_00755 [Candidatus Coatesbacteria bacterium]|nr:hypothetical protein [Candidatus Coatesbacteria bacterium]